MSVSSGAVLMGRRQAEARMKDSCVINRVTGQTLNESTGLMTDVVTAIYTGKCRLRYISPRVFEVESAAQMIALERPTLSIPVGAAGSGNVRANDVATMTAVDPAVGDPALVGERFRLADAPSQTGATARRCLVEVVS